MLVVRTRPGRETSAGVLQPLLMDVKPGPNAERAEEDVQEAVIPKVYPYPSQEELAMLTDTFAAIL